jgi:hypothetical protein
MAPSLLDPSPTGFNILNTDPMQTHVKDDVFKPKNQVYVRIIPYFGLIHSLYTIYDMSLKVSNQQLRTQVGKLRWMMKFRLFGIITYGI